MQNVIQTAMSINYPEARLLTKQTVFTLTESLTPPLGLLDKALFSGLHIDSYLAIKIFRSLFINIILIPLVVLLICKTVEMIESLVACMAFSTSA